MSDDPRSQGLNVSLYLETHPWLNAISHTACSVGHTENHAWLLIFSSPQVREPCGWKREQVCFGTRENGQEKGRKTMLRPLNFP